MTDSLKIRLVSVIVILSVVPAVPLSFFFQDLTSNLLDVTLDKRIEDALEDAVDITRVMINRDRSTALHQTREIAQSGLFLSWMRRTQTAAPGVNDASSDPVIDLMEKARIFRLVVYSSPSQVVMNLQSRQTTLRGLSLDSAFIRERLTAASEYSRYHESENLIVVAVPVLLPNARRGLLMAQIAAASDYSNRTGQLIDALRYTRDLESLRPRLQTSFFLAFLFVYTVVTLLSVFLGVLFSIVMLRPINSLLTGTRQISAGNWDYQIPLDHGSREFKQLAESFNAMVVRIRDEKDRALHLEKMAAWREIAQRLAHEIKNPLTPIQLMVQQIRDSYHGNDQVFKRRLDEATGIIQEEISNLRNLTKEFSEFARLPILSIRKAGLSQILRELRALYSDSRLEVEINDSLPEIDMDPDSIRRVLINLVDNALMAIDNRADGRVHVRSIQSDEKVRLTITDTGHGISRENLSKIFEPHFSTKKSSMGLGLAIVKSILDEHRAMISVESVENLGTTFMIELHIKMPTLLETL